jgi:hypothetical protein
MLVYVALTKCKILLMEKKYLVQIRNIKLLDQTAFTLFRWFQLGINLDCSLGTNQPNSQCDRPCKVAAKASKGKRLMQMQLAQAERSEEAAKYMAVLFWLKLA